MPKVSQRILEKFHNKTYKRDNCVYEVVDISEACKITGMSASAIRNAFVVGRVAGRISLTGRIYLSLPSLLNEYPAKEKVQNVLGE